MRGLTILVAGPDPGRLRSALGVAATQAALGGKAMLFLDAGAVPLLAAPVRAADDDARAAAGLPTLAQLLETGFALGVSIMLCQSGLALAGIAADRIDPRIETGGLTHIMTMLADDRFVIF